MTTGQLGLREGAELSGRFSSPSDSSRVLGMVLIGGTCSRAGKERETGSGRGPRVDSGWGSGPAALWARSELYVSGGRVRYSWALVSPQRTAAKPVSLLQLCACARVCFRVCVAQACTWVWVCAPAVYAACSGSAGARRTLEAGMGVAELEG